MITFLAKDSCMNNEIQLSEAARPSDMIIEKMYLLKICLILIRFYLCRTSHMWFKAGI